MTIPTDSPPEAAATEARSCTTCLARDRRRTARYVARDSDGLEWFECGEHDPTDNVAETVRVAREPLAAWIDRIGAAPTRTDFVSEAIQSACAKLGISPAVADKLSAPTRTEAEQRAQRDAPSWLVKDFCALYRAALAEVSESESPTAIGEAEIALRAQLARLRPAFEVCESERRGAPDRLTAGEQFALTGLHRWLHSPGGDCELTESAQPYHEQLASESPAECNRLEAEEERAYRADDETPAAGVTRPVFDLTAAARDYYKSDLRYRAPEHLSPRDRLIIEAVDAEEALRAESPDEWVKPEGKP